MSKIMIRLLLLRFKNPPAHGSTTSTLNWINVFRRKRGLSLAVLGRCILIQIAALWSVRMESMEHYRML